MILKIYQWLIFIMIIISFSTCKSEKPHFTFAEYNQYYHLDFPGVFHNTNILPLADYQIAVHYFEPADSLGTVMVVHGYYDHVAIEKNLIAYLLRHGYTVIAYDLPGHGLSSGPRADIGDFAEYTNVMKELNNIIFQDFNPPYYLIGHSTGAAIIIDGLMEQHFDKYSEIILVSPLIHSDKWKVSKTGNAFAALFVDSVPRVFRTNSSSAEYTEFVKKEDILQYRKVPLNWFRSLVKWNEKISQAEVSDREILVIQGDKDSTVDWKYNLDFIRTKFPQSTIIMIEEGNHQLYNEIEVIRESVFEEILDYLEK